MSFVSFLSDAIGIFNKVSNITNQINSILTGGLQAQSNVQKTQSQISTAKTAEQIIKKSDNTSTTQEKAVDKTVRLQFDPSTDTKLPVLYGRTTLSGNVIDACVTNSNTELQVCFALGMATGNKIDGTASAYTVRNVYIDDQLANFQSNGQLVASLTDNENNTNTDYAGKLGVYVYNTSANHIQVAGYPSQVFTDARNVFATWSTTDVGYGLLFAIVRIAFDPDLGLDKLPTFAFDIENTMALPGDCLYDYLTNTVYGAGIAESNIKVTSL